MTVIVYYIIWYIICIHLYVYTIRLQKNFHKSFCLAHLKLYYTVKFYHMDTSLALSTTTACPGAGLKKINFD